MPNIYLIRHGQDEDNARGILNGHRDEPLTQLGVAQAQEIAAKVKATGAKFDAVYTSPLKRAAETARIVCAALHLPDPVVVSDLIERDFGRMTGRPIASIEEQCAPDLLYTDTILYFLKARGSEEFPQALARAKKFLEQLNATHQDGNILLVTHGDIGKMIYAAYYGLDWLDVLRKFHFGNSDMLELSPTSSPDQSHVHTVEQHNL